MPVKPGGANVPENYDPNTGKYVKGDVGKNKTLTINLPSGGTKEVFCSGPNPLQIRPDDDTGSRFDKLVSVPLFIANIETWAAPYINAGFELAEYGFGDPKIDEPLGIDFRMTLRDPKTGKTFNLGIDFKFIKRSLMFFDDRRFSFHLLRANTDGQFLNNKHINDAYCFLSCDFGGMSQEQIVKALESGDKSVFDKLNRVQFDLVGKKQLDSAVFGLVGGEEKLRTMATEQQEQFKDGYMAGLKVLKEDREGKASLISQSFGKGAYSINTQRFVDGKYDTMLILYAPAAAALLKNVMITTKASADKNEIKY